jgi:hypothetical protein
MQRVSDIEKGSDEENSPTLVGGVFLAEETFPGASLRGQSFGQLPRLLRHRQHMVVK